ncbi:BTAD domain-containing putative transcriptional regulator [Nonomuraea sp. NPDC050153]|uniref:AfsR/SARP family transcriptional regulator n=1 Tax=Nonomuraea sp. NPDC050153 TaxID=3364359 RepID=UPI0037AC0E30
MRVQGADGPVRLSAKQRAVLSVLLLHPNVVISTERLVAAVWDDPPRSAVANLQTYVSQLRRVMGGTALHLRTEPFGYACELAPDRLDLLAFEEALRRARRARHAGEHQAAEHAYKAAVSLWRGRPAEDGRLGSAMEPRIAELEEQLLLARSEWIDVRLELGGEDLVAELRTLVAAHPLRERLWAQLMLALHRGGRRSEALDAFRQARAVLSNELGIEPGRELADLHAALLAGDPVPSATVSHRAPLCQLPADTSDFVGRKAELDALLPAARARPDRMSPPIVVVSGLPGVGKTTLTVHAAHLLRADYPDGQVFLRLGRDAAGPRRPEDLLGELLRSLGVDGTLIPGPLGERASLLRQRLADMGVLIVLDDAQDETQVRHLLPGTARSCVLVTSRSRLPALEGATRLQLDLPGEHDARLLLEQVAGGARFRAAPEAARVILKACGLLPLAIRVAGARLAIRPSWPVGVFASRLEDRRLDELIVGGLDVRGTFGESYAALPEPARRAFRLLGLADLGSIAEWSAAALLGSSGLEADSALETLVARGMLDSGEVDGAGQPRYRLHDLLRVFAEERARVEDDPVEQRAALARHVLECLRRLRAATSDLPIPTAPPYPQAAPAEVGDGVGIAWLAAERRTLVHSVSAAVELGMAEEAAELAHHLSAYLNLEGFFDDVERLQRMVIAAAPNERIALRAELLLAAVPLARGAYLTAGEHFQRIYRDCRRIGDSHGAAYALINRAACLHGTGLFEEGLEDAYRAIALLEELGDEGGLDYAWTWPVYIHMELGRYGEAVRLCQERLAKAGDDRRARGDLLRALGTACYLRGEVAEAVRCYRESLVISELIGDRVAASKGLRRLGEALGALGRYDESVDALDRARSLFRECGDGLGEALATYALGEVRLRQGRAAESLGLLVTARDGLGPGGPPTWRARVLRELGRAYAELGEHTCAAAVWRESAELFESGPERAQVEAFLSADQD